jgi:hypothetical protein
MNSNKRIQTCKNRIQNNKRKAKQNKKKPTLQDPQAKETATVYSR